MYYHRYPKVYAVQPGCIFAACYPTKAFLYKFPNVYSHPPENYTPSQWTNSNSISAHIHLVEHSLTAHCELAILTATDC